MLLKNTLSKLYSYLRIYTGLLWQHFLQNLEDNFSLTIKYIRRKREIKNFSIMHMSKQNIIRFNHFFFLSLKKSRIGERNRSVHTSMYFANLIRRNNLKSVLWVFQIMEYFLALNIKIENICIIYDCLRTHKNLQLH